ncbi:MAG TPA: c-type cytochrome domain-containing protein [Acidobacteriaceae bacterium]|nr:c-type cytochrome domain-containing protein [Acidobacteriaceae bacterium]
MMIRVKGQGIKLIWVASLVVSVSLLLLPFVFRLDGKTHADWQQFLGRFHPLVVHLPIGLILLVPLLEVAGRARPALHEAAVFVLSLSLLSCLLALTLGYLLAYGSGEAGAGVSRHMWGAIALTIGVLGCVLLRGASGGLRGFYPYLLAGVLLLLAWTAHQGGSLTHGDKYLTEYLPQPLKRLGGMGTVQAKAFDFPDSFYARHLYPVFDANCVVCHGEQKVKGGLRLDTYDRLMRGGKEGAVIIPGKPDRSILLERITLPTDHKKFMPSEGKPPLKPEEITWIRAWILQGASQEVKSLAGIDVPEPFKEEPLPQVGDYSKMMGEISQTAKAAGVTLVPVSRNLGDGLILNTVDAGQKFGDAQLAGLVRFAPYIVEAELGRTAVTDGCFATLGKFPHLRAIHLEGTAVTGTGLTALAQLPQLSYLNLSGTQVTQAAIAPLTSMKNLRHLYLYNTPAQPASVARQEP